MEEKLLDTVNTKIFTYFKSYSSFGLLLNTILDNISLVLGNADTLFSSKTFLQIVSSFYLLVV